MARLLSSIFAAALLVASVAQADEREVRTVEMDGMSITIAVEPYTNDSMACLSGTTTDQAEQSLRLEMVGGKWVCVFATSLTTSIASKDEGKVRTIEFDGMSVMIAVEPTIMARNHPCLESAVEASKQTNGDLMIIGEQVVGAKRFCAFASQSVLQK